MKTSPLQTALNIVLALIFAVFAWFQRNDIDPAVYYKPSSLDATLWFLFYSLIAVLFILTIFRKIPSWILVVSMIFCLIEMIITGPGLAENLFGEQDFTMTQVSMSAEDPRVELSREFFGALIALAGVVFLFFQQKNRK
ncbi:MAG: transmembrane 220 family protein [Verrucomicrobiales bacterium]|nr:transmembrane 220 family protein [Verrucomicrobiales bacterium]